MIYLGDKEIGVVVDSIDLSQTTATADDVLEGKEFFNASGEKVTGTYKDMLQAAVDSGDTCSYLFYYYKGKDLDLRKLDTSRVKYMTNMFAKATNLLTVNMNDINTSNVIDTTFMFSGDTVLTEANMSGLDLTKVTNFAYMFENCKALTTINCVLDFRSVPLNNTPGSPIYGCTNITTITFKNVGVSLSIGSGTSWGHLLSIDSLLNTIKELWNNTGNVLGGIRKLTMGTANTAKLENIYVKLIEITEEMRAEDEYIDNKAPFEVCESTDDGAMLITEYVTTVKNWQLA